MATEEVQHQMFSSAVQEAFIQVQRHPGWIVHRSQNLWVKRGQRSPDNSASERFFFAFLPRPTSF